MQYQISIVGVSPIIMHCGYKGLDTRSAISLEIAEITSKKGGNRTVVDDQRLIELECQKSLWWDDEKDTVTVPQRVIRSNIETASRKLKQGPLVREGLVVLETEFEYDTKKYGVKIEELGKKTAFTTPVVIKRNRILRTRAKFDEWSVKFVLDTDPEIVDETQIKTWLDIAGRRVGLGDWRPEKSGHYGRYEMDGFETV